MSEDLTQQIIDKLRWLGAFGKDDKGGITRVLYSQEWIDAQKALAQMFEDEGLMVHRDEIGNLFGRLEGTDATEETVLSGSHIDTVVNGGFYDGQYGIMTAYLAIKYLKEKYGQPYRNLEVAAMAEEEGSRFPSTLWGSSNIVGKAKPEDVANVHDFEGVSFEEAMHEAGFDYKKNPGEVRSDLKAFIEAHVEQGGVLEAEQIPIGIVQYIVGQKRFTIEVTGEANHAGTTPMGYRKDAMNASARMIQAVNDMALSYGDPLVATVGKIMLEPNTVNVVPGKATFTLDTRHTQKDDLEAFEQEVTAKIRTIASEIGVEVSIDKWMDADPTPMDPNIVEVIQRQCDAGGLNYKLMHSGAGHDSQNFAEAVPTSMIFVPSHKGISHSPEEYTEPEDLAEGVKAMIGALYELGYRKDLPAT